ncbi:hypothetical protein H8L32_09075 [Undibacterium sp. CY18W]|uniref:Lipoprotein n=1 Tax=Undibacterium hunanense TaxID=2762292 RepID=A0ABR6ZP58_9BURK|nr:hypothetical protein [Undibacterium hunanense]MBC3917622.1 hypothetical protein [Undibacterium hunanense]
MTMTTSQRIFSIAALLTLSACAQASGPGDPTADPEFIIGLNAARGPRALTALDDKLEALIPAYTGHVCADIVADVKKLRLNKDEFESTADYQSRIGQLANAGLHGQLRLSDTLAFVHHNSLYGVKYDADKSQMSGSVGIRDSNQWNSEKTQLLRSKVLDQTYGGKSKGQARTESGISVNVDRLSYQVCALNIANSNSWQQTNFDFNIPAAEARLDKGRLKALFVGHLVPQFIQNYDLVVSPSVKAMWQTTYTGNALVFQLEQIWIYNQVTGRVYKKIKPSN